jgi:hypothetical protein
MSSTRILGIALYVALMIAVVVGVDFLFLRERLLLNVGIILAFGAFYLKFLDK